MKRYPTPLSPVLLLTLLPAAPCSAETISHQQVNLTVEERLHRLENELGSLRKENQELRQALEKQQVQPQPAPLAVDTRAGVIMVKPAGKEPTLAVGGLLQVQADGLDKGDSRFTSAHDRFFLRRARLNASGRFLEEFDFRAEVELAGSLSEASAIRAQMTDGYLNWNTYDFANIRAGQFKTPFGYEQLFSDPKLTTIERSLANDRLTLSRQLGVQVGGDFFEKRLNYATGIFNGTGVSTNANDNDAFLWAGRVGAVLWEGKLNGTEARWAGGTNAFASKDTALGAQAAEFGFDSTPATAAKDNIFTGQRTGLGVDSQFRLGEFELWTEFLTASFDQSANRDITASGWYLQGSYFILPKELQGVIKFDSFDPNDKVSGNHTDTWTFGLNYYLKGDDLKLQLNYLISDVPALSRQDKVIVRMQLIF